MFDFTNVCAGVTFRAHEIAAGQPLVIGNLRLVRQQAIELIPKLPRY